MSKLKFSLKLLKLRPYGFIVLSLFAIGVLLRLWGLGNFDISPDEHHFIHEAYRYITGDPYIVPRWHAFRHGVPFVGHPFLGGDLIILSFKIFGASVTTGRLVLVISNIIAIAGTYILARTLFGKSVAIAALAFLVFLPHDVRYGRDAHLDPLLGATVVWAVFFFWKLLSQKKIYWGILAGFSAALVMATKINGPFLFAFYILATSLYTKINDLKKLISAHFVQIVLAGLFFIIPFVLLVAPQAYLDALVNPADPDIDSFSKVISVFMRDSYSMTKRLVIHLYTIPFSILVVIGILKLLGRRRQEDFFLLSVLAVYAHIFVTHSGHSGEYGYITLNPYLSILAGIALYSLKPFIRKFVIFITLLFFLPIMVLHGLRLDVGPFTQLTKFNDSNFRYGQRPYRDAISAINKIPGSPVVLWVKDGDRHVPIMDVRGG